MWALIQSDWCSYKETKFVHTKRHQRGEHTEKKTHEEAARGQPFARQGERPQRKLNIHLDPRHLDLGTQTPRTVSNKFLVF